MGTMMTELSASVLNELDGVFAYLTLNRPQKRNALSLQMLKELTAALRAVGANPQVQVVILKANGSVFSAGHDLSEMLDCTPPAYRTLFAACTETMETIQKINQPVIAQVQGPATAAGCQLVASCDLAVAADSAWFATPGVKIGLFCSTPMVAVSRNIGRKKMMEMLLTGDSVSATEALALGLVNKVVGPEQLEAATRDLARKIAVSSAYIVSIGKQAFYKQIELPQHEAYEYAEKVMARNAEAADAHEGISAFLQKRAANWKGKPKQQDA